MLSMLATAALTIHLFSVNTTESQTDVNETFTLEGLSGDFESAPGRWAAQWNYPPGGPVVGSLVIYTAARLQLHVERINEWSGTLRAFVVNPETDAQLDPPIAKWFPVPVEMAWQADPEGRWEWELPDPPLRPGTVSVFSNPRSLWVRIEGAVPEPAWMVIPALASVLIRRVGKNSRANHDRP